MSQGKIGEDLPICYASKTLSPAETKCSTIQREWDVWVPYAFFAYKTSMHASTKYSPYQLLYGFPATLPKAIQPSPAVSYNYDRYANELRERLRSCYQIARKNLLSSREGSKRNYDKNSKDLVYQANDLVLVRNETKWSSVARITGHFGYKKEYHKIKDLPHPEVL